MFAWLKRIFKRPVVTAPTPVVPPPPPSVNPRTHILLGVVVGHDYKDQGANMCQPYNLSEYMYNLSVANLMQAYCLNKDTIKVEVILRNDIGISGAYQKAKVLACDAVIELHFNAANKNATGTETLCSPESKDVAFATVVQKYTCAAFGRSGASRGIKRMTAGRGAQSCFGFTGPNCLVEPAFGDVKTEAVLLLDQKANYARALILATIEYFK